MTAKTEYTNPQEGMKYYCYDKYGNIQDVIYVFSVCSSTSTRGWVFAEVIIGDYSLGYDKAMTLSPTSWDRYRDKIQHAEEFDPNYTNFTPEPKGY